MILMTAIGKGYIYDCNRKNKIMSPGNKAWKKLSDIFGHVEEGVIVSCQVVRMILITAIGKGYIYDCNRKNKIMSPGNKAWKKLSDTFGHVEEGVIVSCQVVRMILMTAIGKGYKYDCNRKNKIMSPGNKA